jgi:uncharacterized tellurite resistance protein B-like protein
MIDRLLNLFQPRVREAVEGDDPRRLQVATCALLVEIARIDSQFTGEERERIVEIMRTRFRLSEEDASEILQAAEEEVRDSVHLWRFTHLINRNFSIEEKEEVIELLWRVIYEDGRLDRHEDHLIHRIASLLNLTHKQLIDAKLKALNS